MARLARVVGAGLPHHVTQRGNRRQQVFLGPADYRHYLDLLATHCAAVAVEVWAYCLMPNHVHLILVPGDEDGLRAALEIPGSSGDTMPNSASNQAHTEHIETKLEQLLAV